MTMLCVGLVSRAMSVCVYLTGDHASCGSCKQSYGGCVCIRLATTLHAGLINRAMEGVYLTGNHSLCGSCKESYGGCAYLTGDHDLCQSYNFVCVHVYLTEIDMITCRTLLVQYTGMFVAMVMSKDLR